MLSRCGEQFRRHYVEGERIAPAVAIVVGTGVHRGVERNMRAKLENPDGLLSVTFEEVADAARDSVERQWGFGVELSDDERKAGEAKTKAGAIDKAVRLSEGHFTRLAPEIQPTHVERQWVLDLKGYDFQLAGAIDIQTIEKSASLAVNSVGLFTAVRDTKTSSKTPSGNPAETSIQMTCYSLAVKVSDGALPAAVGLDYLIDLKRGPKIETYWSERKEEDFRPFLDRVAVAHAAMEKGIFMPANPDDWWCSKKWCGYWSTCRYPRRPVSTGGGLVQIAPVEGTAV